VLAAVDAVNETSKTAVELGATRKLDACSRARPQHLQHPSDTAARGDGVSEREAGGDQPHHLLITWIAVTVNEIDRITATREIGVASCEKGVEPLSDTVHSADVLAILGIQPQ